MAESIPGCGLLRDLPVGGLSETQESVRCSVFREEGFKAQWYLD